MKSLTQAGIAMPPYVDSRALEGATIAIIQCYLDSGQYGARVNFVYQLLADAVDANGGSLPLIGQFSMAAPDPGHNRRRWTDYFADPNADPLGPVAIMRIDADNESGFVWDVREVPTPAEGVFEGEPERSLFRQAASLDFAADEIEKMQRTAQEALAKANHRSGGRKAVAASAAPPARPEDDLEDAPF